MELNTILGVVIVVVVSVQLLFIVLVVHRNILVLHSTHVVEPIPDPEMRQLSFIRDLQNQ
jgi:hypothetical protein